MLAHSRSRIFAAPDSRASKPRRFMLRLDDHVGAGQRFW
jgi:hypothetical protein